MIHVGGVRHEILVKTLQRFPETRLGKISNSSENISRDKNEIYFDRNPLTFNAILDFYRTGNLHIDKNACPVGFCDELDFWIISKDQISTCCKVKWKDDINASEILDIEDSNQQTSKIWKLLNNPGSSTLALIYYCMSLFFVLLYLVTLALNTVSSISGFDDEGYQTSNPIIDLIHLVCGSFCTLELVLRFIFSPRKRQFMLGPMNMVDLLASLYIIIASALKVLVHTESCFSCEHFSCRHQGCWLVSVLSVLGSVWILKLVRYSAALQKFFSYLWNSRNELFMLVQVVAIMVFFFGSLVYSVEKDEPDTPFEDMPSSFWWAVITMTTVGYGDMVPKTYLGMFVGAMCAMAGVLVVALPVPVIVSNFAMYYSHTQARAKLPKKRRRVVNVDLPVAKPGKLGNKMGKGGSTC